MTTRIGIASKKRKKIVPSSLIYETLDGKPIFYKKYEKVLSHKISQEAVMGYGKLQWLLVQLITNLFQEKLAKTYLVLGGEGGLHISEANNLSLDIAIVDFATFVASGIENRYLDFPPKVVIEIDTKGALDEVNQADYYTIKTQRLLHFGVEQVVWIYTTTQKVLVATPKGAWQIIDWQDTITVMGISFTVLQLLEERGVKIADSLK